MSYSEQIARIKKKLPMANSKDRWHRAYGAEVHRYEVIPVEPEVLSEFEVEHEIQLPECYKALLSLVGGGAGPSNGIHAPKVCLDCVSESHRTYLRQPVRWEVPLSDAEWERLVVPTENDDLSDESYQELIDQLYAGILLLGSMGCSGYSGLVLNGPSEGKVVYIDLDLHKPGAPERPMLLDWYEDWLDGVISGELRLGHSHGLKDALDWAKEKWRDH